MATSISPPPPFLETPGTPEIPWHRWFCMFQNIVLAVSNPASRAPASLTGPRGPNDFRFPAGHHLHRSCRFRLQPPTTS
ncbi:hypothetical protein HPB48_008969 [Haemaphysalis longicornis]|uniref:Uncharacterized protein n=1 Tax=Haemaphysalis longicornis TaxID=44386 RepID=A0A9J6GJ39_HAELO|nr:hypothetical protein HPB48_008969 [Haemaphysalis longicornis]